MVYLWLIQIAIIITLEFGAIKIRATYTQNTVKIT